MATPTERPSALKRTGRVVKTVLAVIGGITVAFLLLAGLLVYELNYATNTISTSVSPDGRYSVEFQSVGQPLFFGNSDARLILRQGRSELARKDVSIADDGAQLSASNCQVSWTDSGATARLSGSEQSDMLVMLGFDGGVFIERPVENPVPEAASEAETAPAAPPVEENATSSSIAQQEAEEIDAGYKAVYDALYRPQGYGYSVICNAKGDQQVVLGKDSQTVTLLIYDRESANGACALYDLERCPVDGYGSWAISDASLLDQIAYLHDSGEVIASGKTSWSSPGTQAFRDATGE